MMNKYNECGAAMPGNTLSIRYYPYFSSMNLLPTRTILMACLALTMTFAACKKEDEGCKNSKDIVLTIDGARYDVTELTFEGVVVAGPSFGAPESYKTGIVFIEVITKVGERIQFDAFSFNEQASSNKQLYDGSYSHTELGNYSSCADTTSACKIYKGAYSPNRYGGETYRSVNDGANNSYSITTSTDGTISGNMKMLAVSEGTSDQVTVALQFTGICFQSPLD